MSDKPPNTEICCGSCGREWPDVIELNGVTLCECGSILVRTEDVPLAVLEAIWGNKDTGAGAP